MKITNATQHEKLELPSGKLNVRFRQMRCMWQCFAGNKYISLASGDTAQGAIDALRHYYNVPENAEITIH